MTMIIRVPGVDWSGKGFPNISSFVGLSDLEFGFDFSNRANRLSDVSGRHADLVPYRQDIAGGITRTVDPTIIADEGGIGISLDLGYLQSDIDCSPIPIDGSMQFTVMAVGGFSGRAFLPEKAVGSNPVAAVLIDFGTGVTAAGFSLEVSVGGTTALGARIKSGAFNGMATALAAPAQKCVVFLTFDGTNWTLHNKTLGGTISKNNLELGISDTIFPNTVHVNKVVMGHYHSSSTLMARSPALYQLAKWNRVLTETEIAQQYERTRSVKSSLSL